MCIPFARAYRVSSEPRVEIYSLIKGYHKHADNTDTESRRRQHTNSGVTRDRGNERGSNFERIARLWHRARRVVYHPGRYR